MLASGLSVLLQLVFHPEKRITVDEALEHAYLADLHGQVKYMRRFLVVGMWALGGGPGRVEGILSWGSSDC